MTAPAYRVLVGATGGRLSGVDVFSAHLVRELTRRGVEAIVLHSRPDYAIPDPLPFPEDVPAETLEPHAGESWRARWRELAEHLERRAPCVYLPNYDWHYAAATPLLSNRVAVVGSVHSDDPRYYEQLDRLGSWWNAVVAVSARLQARAEAIAPGLAGRIERVPYGVVVPDAPPPRDEAGAALEIVYTGRLVDYQKRVLRLAEVAKGLRSANVPFRLTIVGAGEDEGPLRDALAAAVPESCFRFTGSLPNHQVLEILRASHAFVLTSEFEGLPVGLLEAMAQGAVPVVERVPSGVEEVVEDGRNGYLVTGTAEFVERLAGLGRDGGLGSSLSREAWRTVRQGYRIERVADLYVALFERLLREAASGAFRRPRGRVFPVPGGDAPATRTASDVARALLPSPARALARRALRILHPGPQPAASAPVHPARSPTIIAASPLWSLNGVNVFSQSLVRGLRGRGHDARILITEPERPDLKPLSPPADLPVEELRPPRFGGEERRLRALRAYLEAQAPCVYLPNHDYRHAAVASRLSERVKVVGIVHSDDPEHYAHLMRCGRAWAATVAVSPAVHRHVAGLEPALAPRLRMIPYGVETSPMPPARHRLAGEPIRLVYSGRLVQRQKRILDLVGILRALEARRVPATLEVIGGGPERQLLEAECAASLAPGSVRFRGILPHERMPEALERSEVVLLTSAYEGLPLALLEAMARGCVPVASEYDSGRDSLVRDGINGFRVPIGDVEAFAERIARLWRDPALGARLATAAHRTVAEGGYTTEAMVSRYLKLFDELWRRC